MQPDSQPDSQPDCRCQRPGIAAAESGPDVALFLSYLFFLCLREHAFGPRRGPNACEPSVCQRPFRAFGTHSAQKGPLGPFCAQSICKGPLGPLQMLKGMQKAL